MLKYDFNVVLYYKILDQMVIYMENISSSFLGTFDSLPYVVKEVVVSSTFNNEHTDVPDEESGLSTEKTINLDKTDNKTVDIIRNFKSDESNVYVQDIAWDKMKLYLEDLIQLTVADPMCDERNIHLKLIENDFNEYFEWADSLRKRFSYPIRVVNGNDNPDGIYNRNNQCIRIYNCTKKDKEAREFPYKIFEGQIDKSKLNPMIFYELMRNAGFTEDDFTKGKYGYQDQIYVKPVYLKNIILDKCALEMKETILSTLKKVTQLYVAFILELDRNVPYTLGDLRRYGGRESFFHEIEPLGKLFDHEENRIYIVYFNDKKSTLDLHGLALNEAKEKVIDFIKEKYNNFETECTIITGKGNHVNDNGTSCVLKQMLPMLAKTELKSYIQYINLCNGGGLYNVKLFKATNLILSKKVFEEDVEKVIYFISKENEKGHNRLKVTHEDSSSEYIDQVIITAIRNQGSNLLSFPTKFNYGSKSKGQLMWVQKDFQKKVQQKQNNSHPQQKKSQCQINNQINQNNGQKKNKRQQK